MPEDSLKTTRTKDPAELSQQLEAAGYLAPADLQVAVFLALELQKPLLLEGEAGVGKTELALAVARMLGRPCVRLQCYEGLDATAALYDWDYPRQLLALRQAEAAGQAAAVELYSDTFLLRRPLLRALEASSDGRPPVLLIDELDRADPPFDAFLLEFLADFAVTIPEFGRVSAATPPPVFLTSNRTRELHDAIKRRCLYHWLAFPGARRELAILRHTLPGLEENLAGQIVQFTQKLRELDLYKLPGIAETLDWAQALQRLQVVELTPEEIGSSLGALLKHQDDLEAVRSRHAAALLESE